MIYLYNTKEKRLATTKESLKFYLLSTIELTLDRIENIFKGW